MQNGLIVGFSILLSLIAIGSVVSLVIHNLLAPATRTPRGLVDEILKAMNLKKGEEFIDLGAGDARMVFRAVEKYGVAGSACEISPILILFARVRQFINPNIGRRIELLTQDLFSVDLAKYDTIYVHLNPKLINVFSKRLDPFKGELYSYVFPLPRLKPSRTISLSDGSLLFMYKIG